MSQHNREESPAQIEAEIEQTRAKMGEKIDRISERLSPDQLKMQAKETANEVLTDTANAIGDYFRSNRQEIGETVADTIKRNPIPAALIGVGLGWLVIDGLRSSDKEQYQDDYDYRRRYIDPYRVRPRYESEAWAARNVYSESYQDDDSQFDELTDQTRGAASRIRQGTAETGQQIQEKAEQADRQIRRQAGQVVDEVGNIAEQVGSEAKNLGEQVSQVGDQIGGQAQQVSQQISRQVSEIGQQANQLTDEYGRKVQLQTRRAGRKVERSLEENPLAFSAVALGVGVAVGLLLPQTRAENRLMGETSDRLMESAQEVARDAAQRAQKVVEEVRPELEQTAERVVSDLRDTGQQTLENVQDVAQEAQGNLAQTMEKAQEKAKSEAEQVKQKAAEEADKVRRTAEKDVSGDNQTGSGKKSGAQNPTSKGKS